MRETYQILLTSNCDASLLLFCDRAYSKAKVAVAEPIHALSTIEEDEVVRIVVEVVVARRRTLIAAIAALIEER